MTKAEDFASRFNSLEFVSGNALESINFLKELDDASEFSPDEVVFPFDHRDSSDKYAFYIFMNAHTVGTYTFGDGSKMNISFNNETKERTASVL